MLNFKSTFITILFLAGSIMLVSSAVGIKTIGAGKSNLLDVEIVEESTFQDMDYYSVENGEKVLEMTAQDLRVVSQRDLYFTSPDGALYNEDGDKIAYTAREGEFKDLNKELMLKGNVDLQARKGRYQAEEIYYNGSKEFLEAKNSIQAEVYDASTKDTIKVSSNYMTSWLNEQRSLFIGDVEGELIRKRAYEGSFSFEAQRMELDQAKSLITLNSDVLLERNNYTLTAQRAKIFLENFNKKLKYYVLYDDIKLVEELKLPNGTSQTRRAYSEKLEGFMSQGKVVLTGTPSVEQGGDLIKGYQITLRENVELVEVEEAQSSFQLKK